jgi:hypothetical protein
MCMVSSVGDNWRDNFPSRWPTIMPSRSPEFPPFASPIPTNIQSVVSKEEFLALKREVEELRALLVAAKKFDEATNQHDCEQDEKVAFIKKLAEFVGVDMGAVFK